MVPLSRRLVRHYALTVESGVRIESLEAGAPAQSLAVGDVIIAIDAAPVRSIDDLQRFLGAEVVGRTIAIHLIREVTPVEATR